MVTGYNWNRLKPVQNCKKTGLHQFRAVAVAVMSILGNKNRLGYLLPYLEAKNRTGPDLKTLDLAADLDFAMVWMCEKYYFRCTFYVLFCNSVHCTHARVRVYPQSKSRVQVSNGLLQADPYPYLELPNPETRAGHLHPWHCLLIFFIRACASSKAKQMRRRIVSLWLPAWQQIFCRSNSACAGANANFWSHFPAEGE